MKPSLKPLLSLLALSALPCGHSLAAERRPLQVFILAGQSNMQGHAKVSTFEHLGMDPATKPMLAEMLGADGKPKVCERVWISSIGCAAHGLWLPAAVALVGNAIAAGYAVRGARW